MNSNKTVAAATLGCKVNFYETEAMLSLFKDAGYSVVDFSGKADVYIINTCTVTNLGDKKSRQMIRRAAGANPDAITVAVGCYVQAEPEAVRGIPGVDILIGTKDRTEIVNIVGNHIKGGGAYGNVSGYGANPSFERLSAGRLSGRQRAFLKIQDGCDRYCSYCIIPYVRGPVRSRPLEDISEEARLMSQNGYKEIVLSGIHVSAYGKDIGGIGLIDAIRAVSAVPGIERVRMSSIEPTIVTEAFVDELRRMPNVCDHFHLSLQSGCEKTLKNMNRRYTPDDYRKSADLLRRIYPDVAITTDVISGFPGETENDFLESVDFCREIGFSRLHVFPFSPKKGTRAYDMTGQLPRTVKNERAKRLIGEGNRLREIFAARFAGREMPVLFERRLENGDYAGYTTNYLPAVMSSDTDIRNKILNAPVCAGLFDKETDNFEI